MATSASYYLNAPSLGSATAIFTNADLTICAPNGFYSDGTIVREQVGCVLLPQQTCPTCATPCGSTINASGGQGIYLLDLDTGSTVSDVGAVIVRFNPYSVPDGIRATLGSTVYNKLSSSYDGLHKSSTGGNFTFIGNVNADCGISGTTYPNLTVFEYIGSAFVDTGTTQSVSVAAGDVSLSTDPNAPGNTIMVIPKLTASPSVINFEVVGPCSGTAWNMSVACPVLLTGFSSSTVQPSSQDACVLPQNTTYYNASLYNTPGLVGMYDFVFADAYGATPLTAGFYKATGSIASSNDWFQVDANGIVVAMGVCSTPPVSYNCINGNCIDPGDGTGTYSTLSACEAVCGGTTVNVASIGAYMEPCIGGTIDDYMGVNVSLDASVTTNTSMQLDVLYTIPPNNCSGGLSYSSFTVTIPEGASYGEVNACTGGQYFPSGANICDYCISFCDNPEINLGAFGCN